MKCTNIDNSGEECPCEKFKFPSASKAEYGCGGQLLCANQGCRHYQSTHNDQEVSLHYIVSAIKKKREIAVNDTHVSEARLGSKWTEAFAMFLEGKAWKEGASVMDQCWCITIGVTCDYQSNVGSEWMGVLHKNTQYSSWQQDPSAGSYRLVMDGLAQKIK